MTFFIEIRDKFNEVSGYFYDTGEWCKGTLFVGGLEWGFKEASYKLTEIAYRFSQASDWADELERRLRDLLSVDGFFGYLEDHYPEVYYLFRDPTGQVKRWMGMILELEPRDMQSGSLFIKALIQKHLPILWNVYIDSWGFIRERIEDHLDTLRLWMGNILGLSPYEINYPERWVEFLIDKRLPTLYIFWKFTLPEFKPFFQDPRGSIRVWLANLLNLSPYEANYPERWIEFIITKAYPAWPKLRDDPGDYITDQLLSYIENRVADLYERIGNLALEILARLLGV